jgi:hypothetical protein
LIDIHSDNTSKITRLFQNDQITELNDEDGDDDGYYFEGMEDLIRKDDDEEEVVFLYENGKDEEDADELLRAPDQHYLDDVENLSEDDLQEKYGNNVLF